MPYVEIGFEQVYIQVQMNCQDDAERFLKYSISKEQRPKMSLLIQRGVKNAVNCKYRTPSQKGWKDSEWKEYAVEGARKTDYVNVEIPLDCMDSAALFVYCLEAEKFNIKKGDIIGIWGDVKSGYGTLRENSDFSSFNFSFRNIKGITVFEKDVYGKPKKERVTIKANEVTEEERKKYRERLLDRIFEMISEHDDDNLGFFKESLVTRDTIQRISEKLQDKRKLAKRWGKLEKELGDIAESSLIKSTAKVRTECRTSNLFSFHPDYRKLYRMIQSNQRELEGVDFYHADEEFKIARLPELYEVWCCIKLVLLFVKEYNFKILGINEAYEEDGILGLKKFVEEVLREQSVLNGAKFELYSDEFPRGPMQVTIWYDREFQIDKAGLSSKKIFAKKKRSRLRPDLFMQIKYCGIPHMFVFDAKYRGNRKRLNFSR